MIKQYLKKFLIIVCVILVGIVAAYIFWRKNPKKAEELWNFFKKDDFENLFTLYDYLSMAMPKKNEYFIGNIFNVVENFQHIYCLFNEADLEIYKKYIAKQNYEFLENPYILTFVMHTRINKLINVERKFLTFGKNLAVNKITFPDGDVILESYFKENHPEDLKDPQGKNGKKKRRVIEGNKEYYTFAAPKDFDLQSKIDMFWNMHPDGVYIHADNDAEMRSLTEAHAFVIEDLRTPEYTIFGKSLDRVSTFSKRLTTFRENQIQRSYLLIGRAGTGKSTFCLEVAKHLGGKKVMKISAELFAAFNKKDLDFILQCLRPHFVVIDDFDRVYVDYNAKSQDILYFFENLKHKDNCNITVFCTINNISKMGEAIIRPGRFDEIMVFNLPDEKERKVLISEFVKHLEINPTELQLNQLTTVTKGFSHAYLKEYCLELKYDPDFRSLIERIAVTRQFVDDSDFDDISDLDVDTFLEDLTQEQFTKKPMPANNSQNNTEDTEIDIDDDDCDDIDDDGA